MEIFTNYSDFLNIFSLDSIIKPLEQTGMNNYSINLLEAKQPPYNPVYSLKIVKLKMLKTYIKVNLASSFIGSFKFLTVALILFV